MPLVGFALIFLRKVNYSFIRLPEVSEVQQEPLRELASMHSYRAVLLILMSAMLFSATKFIAPGHAQTQQPQRLVESVDITGNRRLRKDDVLYYVQTRAGDPFNEQQVQRDLQAILALGFFDKTSTRVLTEEGARGGVNVIFEVKELPIIRDLQFEGLKSVPESDVLKAFRERRVGVSKESIYDPVKVRNATRVLKELLAATRSSKCHDRGAPGRGFRDFDGSDFCDQRGRSRTRRRDPI